MSDRCVTGNRWYTIANAHEIPSPALAIYPDRLDDNIRRMIRMAGDVRRLRPHVKTHKTSEVVARQVAAGLTSFKCATIAEAEMTAEAGGLDILLAMQPVGPAIDRLLLLQRAFPDVRFATIADDEGMIRTMDRVARAAGLRLRVWLDINSGMNRTGIVPGEAAIRLYKLIHGAPALENGGLHVYDGHIHEHDLAERTAICNHEWAAVQAMIDKLAAQGLAVPAVVAGGTPTFPIHARRPGVELSPGTPVLWDAGYAAAFADLDFLCAAVLVGRVVSKPAPTRVCLDLGTKALASEMPQPRLTLLDVPPYTTVGHNEEHLMIQTPESGAFAVGDVVYGIPTHICPTVARYDTLQVIEDGRRTGAWRVTAMGRRITV